MSTHHSAAIRSCGVSAERFPAYRMTEKVTHGHDVVEIFFVHSGVGVHVLGDDAQETLGPGDMGVVPLGKSHCILTSEESMDVLNIFIDPQRLARANMPPVLNLLLGTLKAGVYPSRNRGPFSPTWTPGSYSRIASILESAEREITERRPGFELALELHIRLLLLECARDSIEATQSPRAMTASGPHPSVQRAVDYLQRNWDQSIDLDQVVRHVRMSKYHLCRLFRREVGLSMIDYLQHLRIGKAMELLRSTDLKVIAVASETGFGDLAHFNRTFRRISGLTPSQYRKSCSNQVGTADSFTNFGGDSTPAIPQGRQFK